MTAPLTRLIETIHARLTPKDRPLLIGISGFGGSGKSTLARELEGRLGGVAVVGMDDFWTPENDVRSDDWIAYDRSRLEAQVLRPARAGQVVRYQAFDWNAGQLGEWVIVPPCRYLIVEGISALHPSILTYFDFSIWVDCPLEVARERGLARGYAWGIDETEVWTTRWMPNDAGFFHKHRPDLLANFVYPSAEVAS